MQTVINKQGGFKLYFRLIGVSLLKFQSILIINIKFNHKNVYTNIANVYDQFGWDNFSQKLLIKLKPHLKKWRIKTHYDLACGTGAFMAGLSDLGIKTAGMDISRKMIRIAKEKNPKIKLETGDMTKFKLKQPMDLITCNYDSINHLLKLTDWKKVFKNVHSNLKTNGKFLFDFNTLKTVNNANLISIVSGKNYLLTKKITSIGHNQSIFKFE